MSWACETMLSLHPITRRGQVADTESSYQTSRGDNFMCLHRDPTDDVQFPPEATMASIG